MRSVLSAGEALEGALSTQKGDGGGADQAAPEAGVASMTSVIDSMMSMSS